MLSFHSDKSIKAATVARLKEHHRLDQIIQGTGFDNESNRGCMVGCTLNNYNHAAYETELGLPEWFARLCDQIFEGLPAAKAPQFAMDGLKAIPVGVDITCVKWQMSIARHTRDLQRLEGNTADYAQECRDAINGVITYCQGELDKIYVNDEAAESAARSAAESARSAARSVAWSAAWLAAESARSAARSAESAARSAAWSAAESAAESARSAARSVAWSAAWSAAESAHYEWEADVLISLLKKVK